MIPTQYNFDFQRAVDNGYFENEPWVGVAPRPLFPPPRYDLPATPQCFTCMRIYNGIDECVIAVANDKLDFPRGTQMALRETIADVGLDAKLFDHIRYVNLRGEILTTDASSPHCICVRILQDWVENWGVHGPLRKGWELIRAAMRARSGSALNSDE